MKDKRAEAALGDIDALFRLGVVSGLSDAQLLERFTAPYAQDAEIAFEAIVRRHGPMVLGVCLRVLRDYHGAEDAFQATFLVLALRAHTVQKQQSLGPWLHGVAARIARRALLLGRRRREEPMPSVGMVDSAVPDPALADWGAVLDEELLRLPDKYRLPIILCYIQALTQDEAARALGWTKGTVSGRLARAKEILRKRLIRRGLVPSAGLLAGSLALDAASAAVPASLLGPTVRAARAALLGGSETGLVAIQVASLVRDALKSMQLGRVGRAAAGVLIVGLGAAAVAAPILLPGTSMSRPPPPALPRLATAVRQGPLLDRYGTPLPPRAQMRLGTTLRRHTAWVMGFAFTPDGGAVSAQQDGLVRFFDVASGQHVRTIDLLGTVLTPDKSLKSFAISPDGALLAGAGFAFDASGQQLVHSVWIWDLNEDQLRRTLTVKPADLFCVTFSPDGATLATGGFAGDVQLWDIATGKSLSTFKLGDEDVRALVFAPDSKILATSAQGRGIRLCDLELGEGTLLADAKCAPWKPCFSPDGRLMAYSRLGGDAVVWDRANGRESFTTRGVAAAFAPDSQSLAVLGPEEGAVRVIDAKTGTERWTAGLGWGLRDAGVAFSPDGKTAATVRGGVLRFFDAAAGRELLGTPEAHQGAVSVVRFTPDGRLVITAGDDGTVRLWDAATSRHLKVIPQVGRVVALAVSPDARTLAAATEVPNAAMSIWELATGRPRKTWTGDDAVLALAYSADGELLLSYGRDRVLTAREVATGRKRAPLQPRFSVPGAQELEALITTGAFAPGNRFLAVSTMFAAHVADLATGEERLSASSRGLALAPDGHTLALATPATPNVKPLADGSSRISEATADGIVLFDLRSRNWRRFEIPNESVVALAFTPDGKALAAAQGWRDPRIRLFNTSDGHEIETFKPPAPVTHRDGLAFSPDGLSLAAGLNDTTVLIWRVRNDR
jgi:RNA polymerase sigma factor (sigma-70 family)